MLEYALHFYNNYTVIFYILLLLAVIVEGPITILTLSILAPRFNFSIYSIYIFAFLGEFLGDLLHYIVGRFLKRNILKDKNFELLKKVEKKLINHSLFDKLVVIKYTPPITSIGLIYLGIQKTNLKVFLKNIVIFSVFNSLIIIIIGYNFGIYLADKNDFEYILIGIMLGFLFLYLLIKLISSYLIKKILNGK